jgi:hypothetical protein
LFPDRRFLDSPAVCGPRAAAHGRRTPRAVACVCCLAVALVLASGSMARAEATVVVEVKRADGSAADGVVQLTQGATKLRCTTSKGRCELKGVAGGAYMVELEQAGRPASKPKTVMIPPSGEVKLIVAAN